jgi:type VI secretion system lysozyme-like protein
MADESHVRTPLFDRLVGGERTLSIRGLRESVRRELELLFNTRSSFPSRRLPGAPLTVIDYGIPPLADFSARNTDDQNKLAAALRDAIAAFEPRLAAVRVRAVPPEVDQMYIEFAIEADHLVAENVREPVSFAITVRNGLVQVDAGT